MKAPAAFKTGIGRQTTRFAEFVPKFDRILSRGLCAGIGNVGGKGQMCVEAAICTVLGMPERGDHPLCVPPGIAEFKISLNDVIKWKSAKDRAECLRDLGLAQLGSKGKITARQFFSRLYRKLKAHPTLEAPERYNIWRNGKYVPVPPSEFDGEDFLRNDNRPTGIELARLAVEILTEAKVPGALYLKAETKAKARKKA